MLFIKGVYGISTARMDRKEMPKMKPDKQMRRGDHEYQFTDRVALCKWFHQRSVTMLCSNIYDMQSTSTAQELIKGSATEIPALIQMLLKCIIKILKVSTWSTKEQQLTILIVNLQLYFIYVFFIFRLFIYFLFIYLFF